MQQERYFIGMDLGGTNLRIALVRHHRDTFTMVHTERDPLQSHLPESVIPLLSKKISEFEREYNIMAVGIGVAGMISADGRRVLRAPNLDWTNIDLAGELAKSTTLPCYLLNDLSAITWGEFTNAYSAQGDSLLTVFMGTGIGGGCITSGNLLTGSHGVAGEIGHTKVVFDTTARPCGCGKSGCIEAYLGGKNFITWMAEEVAAQEQPSRALSHRQGPLHPGIIDAAARAYDSFSLSIIEKTASMLGGVLANAVTLLDPGFLLLGGTVWENAPLLRELTLKHYSESVNAHAEAEVVASLLGDDAGIYGAARWAAARVADLVKE